MRKTLSADGDEFVEALSHILEPLSVSSAHVYTASHLLNEVDTLPIIKFLQTTYPSIQIVQPNTHKNATMSTESMDVIIVPVVGFDTQGNRIGMGGGWYDKFLAMHPEAIKVGLAYDECEVQNVKPEAHDVRLDYIVTPTRLIDTHQLE